MDIKIKNFFKSKVKIRNLIKSKKLLNETFNQKQNSKIFFETFKSNYKYNFNFLNRKKIAKYNNVILIGMGGSILGTKAIYLLLKQKIKTNFYFIDNFNTQNTADLLKNKKVLKKCFFIIVSKSGNTLETLVNYSIFKNSIKKNNSIIITENTNNEMKNYSQKIKSLFIEHKKYIGGRFSVLSEVGMLPSLFMGLNIKNFKINLLKKLKSVLPSITKSVLELNQITKYPKNYKTLILLNYDERLMGFLEWLQQLIAESLGKKNKGILPVISSCPKDHHSLAQLYLDGPKDKFFYIFNLQDNYFNPKITNIFSQKFKFIARNQYRKIIQAQKNALIKNLEDKKIPYRIIDIPKINEKIIGQLFSYFMVEVFLLGKLMNIDPLNQPAVEQIKSYTKKFLN